MEFYKPHMKSSPEGYFTWDNEIIAGIAYNPTVVKPEEAPTSWLDLLNPRWAGVINFKLSTSGLQHSVWYAMRQLYGPEYWTKTAELKPRGFDSYVQQYDRMVSGQDHVISTAQYSGYLIAKAKGAPVAFVVPKEGLGVAPGVIGVVDKAPAPGGRASVRRLVSRRARPDLDGQGDLELFAADRCAASAGGEPFSAFKLLIPEDWEAFLKTHTQYVREWDKLTGIR